jgi:hypothetical protein
VNSYAKFIVNVNAKGIAPSLCAIPMTSRLSAISMRNALTSNDAFRIVGAVSNREPPMSPPMTFTMCPKQARLAFERQRRAALIQLHCERVLREARVGGDRIGASLAALLARDATSRTRAS